MFLRHYKSCDAKEIVSWCRDEKTFQFWGGERFGKFPITEKTINDKYYNENGDCIENDNFYPMTAVDDGKAVGHFIMRYLNGDRKTLRFGWVIVDESKRGRGYGRNMLTLGLKYAFEIMMADRVTIGVFENNTPAYRCYRSVGFREAENAEDSFEEIQGTKQRIIELEITKDEYSPKIG